MQQPLFDDLVGLDLVATFDKPRMDRFIDQIRGYTAPQPLLPRDFHKAGLAPFRTLPPQEPPTHTRTRMAAAIAEAVAANGNVTREELLARGFTVDEIATHFTEARRAARVERMAA
jgi:hypothetical protein